jgi:hypothetical protein
LSKIFSHDACFLDKAPEAVCSVQKCDTRQAGRDSLHYVLEERKTPGTCCLLHRRIACRDQDLVYQVGVLAPVVYVIFYVYLGTFGILPDYRNLLCTYQYRMYEFEYFKCKFVKIESKIRGLAEVESASVFLSPLIANPLISPTESGH